MNKEIKLLQKYIEKIEVLEVRLAFNVELNETLVKQLNSQYKIIDELLGENE